MEDETKDVPLGLIRRIIILIFCMLILTLYFTTILVVSAILPQIQGALSATADEISWIMTFNILAIAIGTPMTGWLVSRFGRKRVMCTCVAGFSFATLMCGLSDSLEALIFWRIRPAEDHVSIRRRRFCPACGGRFTTYERVQLRDLVVIKTNGRREDFDRDKLERSIRIAMQKRPIEPDRVDQMISGIVRRLESMGDTDVPSKMIGEIVMETLARIDTVAYVRFASVYKNFQAADDFDKFVSELRPGGPAES